MNTHKEIELKVIRSNRKILLVCPYDHCVERVSNDTLLPVSHIHNCQIYECIPFKRIRDVRQYLLKNRQLKVK